MIKVEFRGSGARPDSGRDLADPGLARGSGLELKHSGVVTVPRERLGAGQGVVSQEWDWRTQPRDDLARIS